MVSIVGKFHKVPTKTRLWLFAAMAIASATCAVAYEKGTVAVNVKLAALLALSPSMSDLTYYLAGPVFAFSAILLNVLLAAALACLPLLQKIGQKTLALCGTEQLAKEIFAQGMLMLGLSSAIGSPAAAMLYVLVILLANRFVLVATVERVFPFLVSRKLGNASVPES